MSLEQGLQSPGPNHVPRKIEFSQFYQEMCDMHDTDKGSRHLWGKKKTDLGLYQLV